MDAVRDALVTAQNADEAFSAFAHVCEHETLSVMELYDVAAAAIKDIRARRGSNDVIRFLAKKIYRSLDDDELGDLARNGVCINRSNGDVAFR